MLSGTGENLWFRREGFLIVPIKFRFEKLCYIICHQLLLPKTFEWQHDTTGRCQPTFGYKGTRSQYIPCSQEASKKSHNSITGPTVQVEEGFMAKSHVYISYFITRMYYTQVYLT